MKVAAFIAAISLTTGAAFAAPAPVEDIATTSSSINTRVAKLERIIKAKQQSEFEMQQRLDALQQDVLDLRGLTEEQGYQMNQMLQRQRQLYDDIANLSSGSSSVVSSQDETMTPVSSSLGETASYEKAVNLVLKERKYEDAIPAFRQFIIEYPQSTYAANANYWLGQLLYNKGDLAGAQKAFTTVVGKYKNSTKRGDSMVKLGMIAKKQGNNASARKFYQNVIKEYAKSAAARIAEQKLGEL
ncbi:tol-pal system protein YbgF [Shewanella surugensis]|uniref:Cell division coordinator CpoB n=1 Tax=Shewanella surugensis TaxID=212020 RepID=A0ABT0LGV5_9GAMM|nr:tol-pal system protein YbgF [Shewanella surugensis]MCL1126396.1 tol-pal system protein YbgF [Shewanella surugensis]